MTKPDSATYSFSDDEIRTLVLFMRRHEDLLDARLDSFYSFLERTIYGSMTIEEAERFFS